jgi:hypothetical protein
LQCNVFFILKNQKIRKLFHHTEITTPILPICMLQLRQRSVDASLVPTPRHSAYVADRYDEVAARGLCCLARQRPPGMETRSMRVAGPPQGANLRPAWRQAAAKPQA